MKRTDYYEICEQKLKYLNYSERTADCYLYHIKQFLIKTEIPPTRLGSHDFQAYLDNYQFSSVSQQNQVINAIRFLYKFGLDRKYDKVSFKRPRTEKKLPRVIDGDIIKSKLAIIKNLKHKTILSLAYSIGLRVSEITNIKIYDIDTVRMTIHIRNAKGQKDRILPVNIQVIKKLSLMNIQQLLTLFKSMLIYKINQLLNIQIY